MKKSVGLLAQLPLLFDVPLEAGSSVLIPLFFLDDEDHAALAPIAAQYRFGPGSRRYERWSSYTARKSKRQRKANAAQEA